MLSDCNYNKVRLLTDLSRISGYLERHAKEDAKKAGHVLCANMCDEIKLDLDRHIEKLRMAVEGLAREGKFR